MYIVLALKVGQTLFKHVLHIVGLKSTNQHRLSLKVSDGGRRDSRPRKSPLDSIYRCYVGFNLRCNLVYSSTSGKSRPPPNASVSSRHSTDTL